MPRRLLHSLLLLPLSNSALAQTDMLTAGYGNERTNACLSEIVLTTSNVGPASFGKIGSFPVDGQVYAQPLYAAAVTVRDGSTRNVVYVATMHDSVYAIDADAPASNTPLWRASLGPSMPLGYLNFFDIENEIGILSTPVIDRGRNLIYVVAENLENDSAVFRLHALDLSDGRRRGAVVISATVAGSADDGEDGAVTFDPMQHLQRPALLLANGTLYVAFGSHADQDPYHGWLLAYDAGTLRQVAVFNTTPDGSEGSIWQSGRGPAADAEGNIYVGAANGDYDGVRNFGQSYLKLSPGLALLDWFTPWYWELLSVEDQDVGSLGPVLIPGTDFVLGGDKAGDLYLMDRNNMGGLSPDDAPSPQIYAGFAETGLYNVALWPSEAGPILYAVERGDNLEAYGWLGAGFDPVPFSRAATDLAVAYQGLTVSSNGGSLDTGILWMTAGDYSAADVAGTLHAYDAIDLGHELWNSEMNPDRDRPGRFAKFVSPTVANGRVYVPTFSNQLAIYGLLARN